MAADMKSKLSSYSKKILIVDDITLYTEMAKGFFRRDQVIMLTAKSGPEAVAIIREHKPDIVFMDLYMPGGDGDEACKEIKSDPGFKFTPIVIVTGSDYPEDIERCKQAGCNAIIEKPLTRDKLLEASRKHLKLPKWSGQRIKTKLQASYGIYSGKETPCFVTDISIGGVFLETDRILPANSTLCLEFRLEASRSPIVCRGRVARVKTQTKSTESAEAAGMGVEFTDIKTLDILSLQSWLSER